MADETFRPRRPTNPDDEEQGFEGNDPLKMAEQMRRAAAESDDRGGEPNVPREGPNTGGFAIKGQPPQEFLEALKQARPGAQQQPKRGFGAMGQAKPKKFQDAPANPMQGSGHLKELLESLRGSTTIYEEIELPSRGRFYDGEGGPSNGVVSIRPMTGEEEQILATPRFVRKGQAINMIFQRCLKEQYRPEALLTIDRTYLLIYLRGISYSPNYDVEVKCVECEKKFATTIDLNTLYVEPCPDDYGPVLEDVLPTSKLPFRYRLSTGKDEQDITDYRDRRIKMFGDQSSDDTLTYRTAMLLDHIDGITVKNELQILLKNLPISDVSFIRGLVNEPPFGVDTNVEIICPSCLHEFEVDLPLEANFFFPRRKKSPKTQA